MMKRTSAVILPLTKPAGRVFILSLLLLAAGSVLRSQPSFPDNGQLFTDTVVPVVYLTVNPDTLAWLYANPYSDREFRATFVFDNGTVRDTIDPVGFRLRGNTSRVSKKKSFKVSFNTFTEGGKYQGVEKMNLNGEHNDPSVMRSKIMWDILRKWDIPAPRANHVRVYINGNFYGVYINVEHIDEEFALSRFGSKDGNLYKCLYPADLNYMGPDPDSYKIWTGSRWVYELTTNEEENDFSDLAEFIGILHDGENSTFLCGLDRVFNVRDYLKIMAVQIFCGDWDGYIFNKNNFYLYHNTLTGKLEYIPYDVDNTFGIDWFGIDWATRNIYDWQPGGDQVRPLYDMIISNPELRGQFSFYAAQLVSEALDLDSLIQAVDARKEMISPYIADDPYYPMDYGFDHNDFLNSFTSAFGAHVKWGIYPYLQVRMASMASQAEAGDPVPVIKRIAYERRAGEPMQVSCTVEAIRAPAVVKLIYTVAGGDALEAEMSHTGNGRYTVALQGIHDEEEVAFNIQASGGDGVTSQLPCVPVIAAPVTGNTPLLFINEFMADNEGTVADEHGNFSDWIEIYNGDTQPVDLGKICLTDSFSDPLKWMMPSIVLPAGGFIVFWADGEPGLGDKHAPFKLDKDGEEIGLFTLDRLVVDTVSFGLQQEDISTGRKSDGAEMIASLATATPGRTNNITSSDDIDDDTIVKIFPNPVTGETLWLSEETDCSVYNTRGVRLFSGTDVKEIDVSNFPAGVYILVTGEGRAVRFVRTGR